MIYDNVLQAIGHTPIIRLNRMNKPGNAQILMKFEGLNVGGSIKTRTAYNMILQAEKEGKISKEAGFHHRRADQRKSGHWSFSCWCSPGI